MATVTCPACGLSFETAATTNTRCRRCRHVCEVGRIPGAARPKAPGQGRWFLLLALDCGHPTCYFSQEAAPDQAAGYLWTCHECGVERQKVRRVIAGIPQQQLDAMDEAQSDQFFDELERLADRAEVPA